MRLKIVNDMYTYKELNLKDIVLFFMVAVYPLIVVPGMFDYFRGPRFIILAILSMMAFYCLYQEKVTLKNPIFVSLYIFMSFAAISTLLADNIIMAWMGSSWRFTGLSTYLFCIILFFLATRHQSPKKILVPMIICAVIASIIGIIQYFGYSVIPHPYFPSDSVRTFSTFGNINWFGTYVVFILPASLLMYLDECKPQWLITTGFIYGGLLVSLTRGVWLAFMVSFLIITFVLYKNKEIRKTYYILLIVLIAITFIFLYSNDWELFERVSTIPDALKSTASLFDNSFEGTGSVYVRIYIWQGAFELFKDNWAFGIGADHLRVPKPGGAIDDKAHNIYFEIATTMGVFALVAYLLFIILLLSRPVNKTGFMFWIMIVTYLIQGLSNNDVVQIMPLFWIAMGLLLATNDKKYLARNGIADYNIENRNKENAIINEKNKILVMIVAGSVIIFILVISFWFFYPSQATVELPGGIIYTGQLRGSKFHGYGTLQGSTGFSYVGDFRHGLFDGIGTITYSNGSKYIGEFAKGYFHGEGMLVLEDGRIIEGIWQQGKLVIEY